MGGSAAQAGFYYQNNVAAFKILESLFFQSDITHIELENYGHGRHIDDVILYRTNSIEYTQVKWSDDDNKAYTLYNLLTAEENKKSIFKQLAEGYQDAVKKGTAFTIILFTNKKRSGAARQSEGLSHGLAEILDKYIAPFKNAGVSYDQLPAYTIYKATVDLIKAETGLSDTGFSDFLKSLEFQFSQPSIPELRQAIKLKMSSLGLEESLYDRLLNKIVEWSIGNTVITKHTVLEGLGILDRFEDKLSHYFKTVDEQYYVANEELLQKIKNAIHELPGGYLFIEGLPGIGKSTALTKLKEENKDIVFAYYCFIPDEKSFSEPRQSATSFFRSMCVAIEKNFADLNLPNQYSGNYKEKLTDYIKALGKLPQKTIFVVDGLDHVHRGIGFNDSSLLNELKGSIPDGVYFILSSQYTAALSHDVLAEIRSDERRFVQVPRFRQREITQYLQNKGIDGKALVDLIEGVSGGIPLYLHYITELLLKSEVKNYDSILQQLPILQDGTINTYHQYLYNAIQDNEFAKWILAILAYRKEKTTVDVLYQILQLAGVETTPIAVHDVLQRFSHLLKQYDGKSYSIFHNSFREFLLERSKELRDRFNRALADYYEQHPSEDEAYRRYFRHLEQLGEHRKIVDMTNVQWVKEAWSHYRPLDEIADNISIAWQACVRLLDLSAFIRIGFLKAQVDKLKDTIENSDIDFPILFLRAGLTDQSLRQIWDGDFVHTTFEGFLYYLGEYYDKTGLLLPDNIVKQGLSKVHVDTSVKETLRKYRVYSLIVSDVTILFEEIDGIQWEESTPEHGSAKAPTYIPEEENQKINNKIKEGVVDFLQEHKLFDKLQQLHDAYENEAEIGTYLKTALIQLLLATDKPSAIDLIESLDWPSIPAATQQRLIKSSFGFLTDEEIKTRFPATLAELPELFETLVAESRTLHPSIRDDIPDAFDDLKVLWTFDAGQAREVGLRISILPYEVQNVYDAFYLLSEDWNKYRKGERSPAETLQTCKDALGVLTLRRPKNQGKSNFGLFDMPKNNYVIEGSLYKLIRVVFGYAAEVLPDRELTELIDDWLEGEDNEDIYRHFSIPLAIAKVLRQRNGLLKEVISRLLAHAERLARKGGDTYSLTETLGKVALAYGEYDFADDFRRLYEELPAVAFGLSYRKDYQASFIIYALEAIHEKDPSGTLSRLHGVFRIQKKLAAAGDGRMRHIVFSELIGFVMKHYPQLGFQLLEKEERIIERSEGLDIILDPLIEIATKEELSLYFSIAQTLPRWTASGDNHFLSVLQDLLKRAVSLCDHEFIGKILSEAKYNADVELEDDALLKPFAQMLEMHGHHDTIQKYELGHLLHTSRTTKKEIPADKPLTADHLRSMFSTEPAKFESILANYFDRFVRKKRSEAVHREYLQWREELLSSGNDLRPGEGFQLLRKLAAFKADVIALPVTDPIRSTIIEGLFDDFLQNATNVLDNPCFDQFVSSQTGRGYHSAGSLYHRLSSLQDLVSAGAISEEEALRFVETASILKAKDILLFIDKWLTGETANISLLRLANRMAKVQPRITEEILGRFTSSETEHLFFPNEKDAEKLGCDIFETMLSVDLASGKRQLLEYFIQRKARYADELIANARRLLKYASYFEDDAVVETYYNANLEYNRQLAEGLPEISEDYHFIAAHREERPLKECIIQYLINLFHFPVFKVRELVLMSVFNRLIEIPEDLSLFLQMTIRDGSNHKALYAVMILRALAEKVPEPLLHLKDELWRLVNRQHFQLVDLSKELLLRLNEKAPAFLSADELSAVQQLNSRRSLILTTATVISGESLPLVLAYNHFLRDLISKASVLDNSDEDFRTDVFHHLTRIKNVPIPSKDDEFEIHRWYNVNTNFDTIEIFT